MGVLLGTLISTVTTSLWVEPYMLYKHGFKQSVWDYFGRYAQYMICIIACTVLSALVTRFIQVDSFVMWTIKAVLVATVSTGIVCVLYRSTEEFIGGYLIMIIENKIGGGRTTDPVVWIHLKRFVHF